jgi:hypothetical protein
MDDMGLFANATVDGSVTIALYAAHLADSGYVSILLGRERITLHFFDAESLERLRDIADEGVRRLRAYGP